MTKRRIFGLWIGLSLSWGVLCYAAASDARTLRFGVTVPERTITVRAAMKPWVDDVNRAADGALNIEFYAGGALGRNGKLQHWMIKRGVLDIAWMLPSNTPGAYPSTDFFEIPLATDDPMEMSLTMWRLYEQGCLPGFEDLKLLAIYVSPPYKFHLRFPYNSSDDLKGRKLRAQTFLQARLLEEAGATPVGGVTTSQLAESLSRDLIEGALFSWHGVRAVGVMRATSVHVDQAITFAPATIAMNRAVYESLGDEARAAIDAYSGPPLIRRLVDAMNGEAERALSDARNDANRQFIESRPADAEIWRARFEKAAHDWRSQSPANERLAQRFDAALAEYRGAGAAGGSCE